MLQLTHEMGFFNRVVAMWHSPHKTEVSDMARGKAPAPLCGFPKWGGGTCMTPTRDPSGQCRHHRDKDPNAERERLAQVAKNQAAHDAFWAEKKESFESSGYQKRSDWDRDQRDLREVEISERLDQDDIRSAIETALERPSEEDYFVTQDALIHDAAASDKPIISPESIGRLINEHGEGDVRVYAIRHPNADAEHLASIAASKSETKVIVEEARQRLDELTGRL